MGNKNKIRQKYNDNSNHRVNEVINNKVNKIVYKASKSTLLKQYITITLGAFLMSAAIVIYFNELEIVVGGVTGIAVILNNTLGTPMWIVNAAVNIPLFIIGYKTFEHQTFIKTIYGTAMLSFFLAVTPNVNLRTDSFPVNVAIGAVLMGMGLGLILSSDASSGGVDMVSTMISRKNKYVRHVPHIYKTCFSVVANRWNHCRKSRRWFILC